ncbi:phage tail family protein [Eubacteriales bacterium OttesenSCG-928-K08]|nr:phage tail family protein [Eubacteriales bacterium OttesenSCG-928-K08]
MLTTQGAKQDGETLHEAYYEPRELDFSGYVYGATQYQMYERLQELQAVIGGKELLRVEYTNDYGSYYISGIVNDPPEEDSRIYRSDYGHMKPISLTIYCPDPLWRPNGKIEEEIVAYRSGRFSFPFTIYPPGVTFGSGGYRKDIINIGDSDAPVEIWIHGPAIRPKISNLLKGEYMAFNIALRDYETLYINTEPEQKTVEKHNEITGEITKELDKLSGITDATFNFWSLAPGVNDIQYEPGQDDMKHATVILRWSSAFAGV